MISKHIYLTDEQAESIRGKYLLYYDLRPYCIDGMWLLPPDVLDNPVYCEAFAILRECPQTDIETFPEED